MTQADFGVTPSFTGALTQAQLQSTARYHAKELQGIGLSGNYLTGWDFSEQNLASASLHHSWLDDTDLTGVNLSGANLD